MKMVQRALVLMLSVLMVLSAFPAATFAEDEAITEDAVNTVEAQEPVKETAPETQPAEVVEPVQEEVKTDAEAVVNEETAPADGESVAEEEEEKYPAQTLKVTASDGAVITVEASEGAFPEDSYVKAKPVSEEAVLALIDGAVEAAAYDITVYDADGNEVQPKKAVEVSFANTGLSDADAVYYVNDAMTKATLVTDSIDDPSDSFTTDHFSFYVVTGLSQESDGWKGYVGSLIEHKSSRSITVGETISLTCNLQSVTSSRPDQSTFNQWNNGWHVVKATSDSPDVSEAISYSTDIFYDRSGAKWKPFITINALKPGTYSVEQWEEGHDGEGLMMTLIIKEKFTVTFNANGHGTAPAEQKVIDGEKATKPDDPSEDGYIFGGWYENSGCTGDPFDFSTPITGNKTLYAKWVKSYKVKFVDEDGTTIKGPDEYEEGTEADAVEKPDDPTKTEEIDEYVYRFAGWEPPVGNVTGDATYKATYTKVPKYRIHYEKNYFFGDGTIDIPSDQFVVSGEPAAVANNPAGGNPYFIAWNTAADGSGTRYNLHGYNGGQRTITLSDNITLYAEWKYSIYFEGNGGTLKDIPNRIEFTNPAEQKIPSGSAEREGYEYLGWATSSNATSAKYVAGDDFDPERFSTTLYAVWKINEYQIKYDLDGGSLEEGKTNPETITAETSTFTLNNPVREGYKFMGWTGTGLDKPSKTVTIAKGSTGDRTYTATWEKLENYSLNVAMIAADEQALASSISEASGKTTVYGANWVADESSLNTLKQYWARESQDVPTYFRDAFQPGDTYYSVALVQFPVDEEPDPARVTLIETEYIKQMGNMAVHRNESAADDNVVVVPFSVTVPKGPSYTITYNLGGGSLEEGKTNPTSYTEADTFTLNNPVKEGYKFLGWTGTGLTEASKEVTVAKRSTGNREYTANWEELDTYSLDVALIHAGVEASTADVEEADDKISIGTTSWVATQSDVDALKAYFAGQSGSGPAPFSDYFRAGETYYSVAIVTFADDEEADARRVKLNTTEFVKSAGDPVVNESENEVIVPFAVTIPAITVTVEFGSNHADLAAQAAASSPEGVTMTANGGTLTYKAEKGSDRWYDVTNPLRNVLADLDTSNPDNGELMYRGFVQYNLHPLDYYASAEACAAEMETAMENVQQNEDLKLYILWTKPADVELTITKPLCGTEVTFDESAREQSPRPAITVTGGNAQIYKYEDDDFSYDPNLWITGGDGGSVDPFSGEIVGGSTYRAMTMLMPDFGYYIEPENITINGGTPVASDTGYRPDAPIYIDVEAEHDWSDWEIKKAPTATEEGLKEHTCKHCNEKMTEVIPAKGYGPGEDPNQKGKDGTSTGRGASEACADKAITSSTSEEGPKGTQFAPLALRSTKQGNTTITLTWTKPSGATKYVVYGVSCGKGKKLKKITTTTKTSYTVKKIGSSKLKKGTYYRFIVVALDKTKDVVSTSKAAHVATKGGKVTNYKSVTTKASKNRVSIKRGSTFKLGAKAVKQSVKLKIDGHRGLRYVSTNTKVATVSTKGTIKGKKKGSCYVYVYAQNGVFKKIRVTVK